MSWRRRAWRCYCAGQLQRDWMTVGLFWHFAFAALQMAFIEATRPRSRKRIYGSLTLDLIANILEGLHEILKYGVSVETTVRCIFDP
jgi:hypothetical protein